jgi:hypothetical protein
MSRVAPTFQHVSAPEFNHTVGVDHTEQSFTVRIRSLSPVSPSVLQNLIEQKFEVVSLDENTEVLFVQ